MSLQGPINYNDFAGLASLRSQATKPDDATLREVARQFESLFTHMMLKSMRDASMGDPLFENSDADTYRDMFDQQMAVEMTRGRGLGIADMLVRQLSGTLERAPEPDRSSPLALPPAGRAADAAPPERVDATSPEGFVTSIWSHARRAGRALGIDPRAIVAQAALETGWGRHRPGDAAGRDSHNLFGIKADARWQGDRVSHDTREYVGGAARDERASFRAYGSLTEAFDDYVSFLQHNPRYRDALAAGADAGAFAEGLQAAGYATDPAYAAKIRGILNGEPMRSALDRLKNSGPPPIQQPDARIGDATAEAPGVRPAGHRS